MKSIKNKFYFSVFLLLSLTFNNLALAKIEVVLGSAPLDGNPNLALKAPSNDASEIIISRDQYVISYNKLRRSPNWIAWKLEVDQIGHSGRSNNFSVDADLETYLNQSQANLHAVDPIEYKGSCFDRGHQIPSADRTDTTENNQMTFVMSNMIPQTPYLNRVVWEHLEQYTRDLVQKQGKKVYIIAGPIYDLDFGLIGPNKDIPVPSKDFKVIIILDANQTPEDINSNTQIISVIMPNTLQDGSNPLADKTQLCKALSPGPLDRNDWVKYKTTLSEIEKLSGLKILSAKAKI
ncbi:MAG: DNA/RNA non-specific endonuclease [Bacteriovorax sp.]|nr:DNA/RNA non-specific endonuclease [Bacteriovorax sp.]